ncbi:MAG: TRAP transporter substrate-binding protein DctP [Candidatus Atribacteria bacterium]|nr:TRAP transporter substrate-binding protein DctP [Candidatus Atribacteria bacterium]
MLKKSIFALLIILIGSLLVSGIAVAAEGEVVTVKMSYNGPANIETNAVHEFAVNFKEFIEMGTNGRILINLFPDSQLGDEEQRMEQTMSDTSMINVASNAGMVSVYQEIYAATLPFMFKSFKAAHIFFDESDYWVKTKKEFREKTGVALLEAIEEGGFLAFTNNKKEIRSPADFKGLKFRGMDPGQVALYKSFGASGIPIPWTELYMAIQTGVVDGQMNPPTYIISGNLYEVQDYMTMANIQYSCQWLTVNAEWLESLSASDRHVIEQAAHAANIRNRISVEARVNERVKFIEDTGVKVYYPNDAEMNQFQEIGQPGYTEWVKEKIDQKYVDLALESSQKANSEATVNE